MSQSDNNPTASKDTFSGTEVYELIIDLCKQEMQILLAKMFESAPSFTEWTLTVSDSTYLAKQLTARKRIIQSSFAFQLEKGFSDYQSTGKTLSRKKDSDHPKILDLIGVNSSAAVDDLETSLQKLAHLYENFYQTLTQRLQFCLGHKKSQPKVPIDENPVHLNFLCEAFQNSIDNLNLETKYHLALYRLFTNTTLTNLAPLYRKIENQLLDHDILPELKPARFSLRDCTNLSESQPPKSMLDSVDLKLVMLLQKFKERTRGTSEKHQNLFPELKEELNEQGYSDYDQQLNQLSQQFGIIFNDEDLPSVIKSQIARLQVFIFISAIREDGLLNRSSHPARRLIDTVVMSEVEIATSGQSEQSGHHVLKDGIDQFINYQTITSESYQDLLTLYKSRPDTTVKQDVNNEQEPTPEDPSKISSLVESILASIVEPLKAHKKSLQIFEEVWSPLMLEVALTQGFNSPAWQKVVAVVKTHVWALIPKSTEKEQSKLMAALPKVIQSLTGVMKNLKFTAKEQKLLLDSLNSEHDDVLEQTMFNIGQATQELKIITAKSRILKSLEEPNKDEEPKQKDLIGKIDDFFSMLKADKNPKSIRKPSGKPASSKPSTQTPVSEPSTETPDSTPNSREKISASSAENMQVGEWVECKQGSKTITAKLIWKADDLSLFIFVDQEGNRISEVDAATLDRELESGQKVLIKAESPGSKRNQSSFLRSLDS